MAQLASHETRVSRKGWFSSVVLRQAAAESTDIKNKDSEKQNKKCRYKQSTQSACDNTVPAVAALTLNIIMTDKTTDVRAT